MARIGIVSFAHMHAYGYASCLKQLPEAELTAVWDNDAERGRAAAAQFETRYVETWQEFMELDTDAVIITAENVRHAPMVISAANRGKWVLCEKPLATTMEHCQLMVDTCRERGVGLGTAFPCRYAPSLMAVQKRIAAGDFGEIYAASCTNNGKFPGGWFGEKAFAGGGATMDHTVHVVDLLRWMLGREFTRVYCENGNLLREGIDTDDVGSLHMEMEGGVIVSHIASWNRAKSFPTWGDVTIEFIGEKGVISVDAFNQKLNVYDDEAMKAEWAYWGGNPDLGLVRDFVAAVNERREPPITGYDGLKAVEVTLAAYKSAELGKAVEIGG